MYSDSFRIEQLLAMKRQITDEKIAKFGNSMDHDDRGNINSPDSFRFIPESNHENGCFYGADICGRNFRKLLNEQPVSVDRYSAFLGSWMVKLVDYHLPMWKPEFSFQHLAKAQDEYHIIHGIGGIQHFVPDFNIVLQLGLDGLAEKIQYWKKKNQEDHKQRFYEGLLDCVFGLQEYIQRHIDAMEAVAQKEQELQIKEELLEILRVNRAIQHDPPKNFRETVQLILWFILAVNLYNGGGAAVGALDQVLWPWYRADMEEGRLTKEKALFYLCCLLLKDNLYIQLGGKDRNGNDRTNELSFLFLEAAHRLKTPSSICVRIHDKMDSEFLRQAVWNLVEDKMGTPNFISDKNVTYGFMKNGYPLSLAVDRQKAGCHWCAIPGREYTLNDCIEFNMARAFCLAMRDMMQSGEERNLAVLYRRFLWHVRRAVYTIACGIDLHMEHMQDVFPELPLDLLCHGPIEKGIDATNSGVEYYNMCIDAAGLAVAADSFSALETCVEKTGRYTYEEIWKAMCNNYEDQPELRAYLLKLPHYGNGTPHSDDWAQKIAADYTKIVREHPTPNGTNMIPGLFSWSNTVLMGKTLMATPDGRRYGDPISHGANPSLQFLVHPDALSILQAVSKVQCGYGNSCPVQIEINDRFPGTEDAVQMVTDILKTYCIDMDGTIVNINFLNKDILKKAQKEPQNYPNLIVRVTGFSAYFAALSPEYQQLVMNRVLD